jgi:disulfide oxidoreductase YuzD
MSKDKLKIGEDGMMPLITGDIKVTYAQKELNTNWLLNKILGTKDKQITKITDDELMKFLFILEKSKLKMPDGMDSLEWLKPRLDKRYQDSLGKTGVTWENVSRRYQFIIHQIDIILVTRTSNRG